MPSLNAASAFEAVRGLREVLVMEHNGPNQKILCRLVCVIRPELIHDEKLDSENRLHCVNKSSSHA